MSDNRYKVRNLTCCCCDGDAGRWMQHWNRDTGYGICAACIARFRASNTVPESEILSLYGKEGVNFAPATEPKPTAYDVGRESNRLDMLDILYRLRESDFAERDAKLWQQIQVTIRKAEEI